MIDFVGCCLIVLYGVIAYLIGYAMGALAGINHMLGKVKERLDKEKR